MCLSNITNNGSRSSLFFTKGLKKGLKKGLVKGFTLVETVIGIVVLSIAFSIMTTLLFPLLEDSADQVHQIRAAELGQSMLNEIQARSFDEKSDRNGGLVRCGEPGISCTANNALTAEAGETRATYDDVDDYNGFDQDGAAIESSLGNSVGDLYNNFNVKVTVCNDGDYDGSCSANLASNTDTFTAKLITVTVTTPSGLAIDFATYRANF